MNDLILKSELIDICFDIEETENQDISEISVNNSIIQFCQKSFENTIEEANGLISQQMSVIVGKDDLKAYEEAKRLFYIHRNLWIKVRKDTELIKKAIKPITQKVQYYCDGIYNPLQESGKKLKDKMLVYEEEQERKKQEIKDRELAQQKRQIELSQKLLQFNTEFLTKIQTCSTIEEIDSIKNEINNYDIDVFEEQIINATFQIAQLTATADMKRSNILMKIEQENLFKTEEQKVAEKRKKEDEELKAYEEKINEKLKQEEEERRKKLEILNQIKMEELEKSNALNQQQTIVVETDFDFDDNIIVQSDLDTDFFTSDNQKEKEELTLKSESLANQMLESFSNSKKSINKEEIEEEVDSIKPALYNERLKEMFHREIVWFVKKKDEKFITEEQLAITLAIIVEKNK